MKQIKTVDAVGHILCHDMTQIIKDEYKGARFHKGHVVKEEDIPVLLSMGKENLYVWEKDETKLHEDEAVQILREICKGAHMRDTEPREGKIELFAETEGLLVIDTKLQKELNSMGEIVIASRRNYFPLKKGDKLAGMRVIPLVIEKEKLEKAREIAGDKKVFEIRPFTKKKVGIVTTGSEVSKGLIKDSFGPVVEGNLKNLTWKSWARHSRGMTTQQLLKKSESSSQKVLTW